MKEQTAFSMYKNWRKGIRSRVGDERLRMNEKGENY